MMDRREHLLTEYRELKKQLKGISPKLALYGQIQQKVKDIYKEIVRLERLNRTSLSVVMGIDGFNKPKIKKKFYAARKSISNRG